MESRKSHLSVNFTREWNIVHGTPVMDNEFKSWYYIYHTWRYDQVLQDPPGRVMNLDKIYWNSEGWPIIGTGIPSDTPQNVPR